MNKTKTGKMSLLKLLTPNIPKNKNKTQLIISLIF